MQTARLVLINPPEFSMAGIALRVPGLYPTRPAHVRAEPPLRAESSSAPRHPLAAKPPCPLSCPPLCHPSAN
ncbi:conserved protein of unknown function [Paraburkholderia dioscoreae]|uniref:Uncharacterized protein n=1 Tax=Paraburkholderia dioscoreae TaxID=2604047 RepID=A0A5Q4ZKJ3_9BURK|nr:conserved protein of unknown function [Paraburkholderia dioscoreae]